MEGDLKLCGNRFNVLMDDVEEKYGLIIDLMFNLETLENALMHNWIGYAADSYDREFRNEMEELRLSIGKIRILLSVLNKMAYQMAQAKRNAMNNV